MKIPYSFIALAALVAVCADGPHVHAATLAIPVAADTYIRNDGSLSNSKNDNDPDNEIIVGTNPAATNRLNGLLRFDVSSLAAMGQLQINSVTLEMATRGGDNGASNALTLNVREYGFEFVEADATYNDPDGDGSAATGDTTPGGTFGTILSTLAFDPAPQNTPHTFGSSQAFIDALVTALGTDNTLNLLLAEDSPDATQRFARFQDEDLALPPTLVVDFDILAVPEPASLAVWTLLGVLGVSFSVFTRWVRKV